MEYVFCSQFLPNDICTEYIALNLELAVHFWQFISELPIQNILVC